MNASNLQPTVVNLFVVSLKEVLTLDHADTNQIINTVSWLHSKPFVSFGLKTYLVVRMAFVDRAFFFCGWVPGTLGWLSKRGGFFFCAFCGNGFVWKEKETKGNRRRGCKVDPKKKLFSWSEIG